MIPQNWPGMLVIEEIKHIRDDKVIYEEYEIPNTLHLEGEQLFLGALFQGGPLTNPFIPETYYFGLDNRSLVDRADTLATIGALEPQGINGYARQPVNSISGFTVDFDNDRAVYKASSTIITFRGQGGTPGAIVWGPVQNLFMTDRALTVSGGTLIASAVLSNPVNVQSGDSVSMRMSLAIRGNSVT